MSLAVYTLLCILASVNCDQIVPRSCSVSKHDKGSANKEVYRVGVLAIRGFDDAIAEFNSTFSTYLTQTVGLRFEDKLIFQMIPLDFVSLFTEVDLATESEGQQGLDFIYVNPSAFSCIESEYGANTLVSQISSRKVGENQYSLTKFGGVIFARADNDDIQEIKDLRDKRIACASISGLGSGQMQFRKMQQYGIHHLQDPKQVVFTSDQEPVVYGVLDGKFDVGFVRTDQLERTKDNVTGELIDRSLLKIINVIPNLTLDGVSFPFQSSTELYPEWNVASLVHVQDVVAEAVQNALLALNDYAIYGEALGACFIERNCTAENATCQNECYKIGTETELECIPPPELALLSVKARTEGKYSGWRTTLSYMELRNMQEETGFISLDPFLGLKRCVRTEEIFEAIVCPEGHFRQREDQVLDGCKSSGLDCYGYQCLCKPCVRAFDVDVFPLLEENQVVTKGCDKFAICGSIVQGETIKFRAIDNKQRSNVVLKVKEYQGLSTVEKVILPLASKEINLSASDVHSNTFDFELSAEGKEVGSIIFEIYIGEEQIPQSPFRLLVTKPDCSDLGKEADASGKCVCLSNTLEISGNCVGSHIIVLSVIVPLFILLGSILLWYVDFKRRQADSVWIVKKKELKFHDPPEVVGRGTFGLVLLAEYRGTQVAVKRVIPPKPSGFSHQDSANGSKSFLDSGQTTASYLLNDENNLNDAMAINSTQEDQATIGLSSGASAEVESTKARQNRNIQNSKDIAIDIDHFNDYEENCSNIPGDSKIHRLNSVQFAPGVALVSINTDQGDKFRSSSLTIEGKMKSKVTKLLETILEAGGCRDVYADLKKDFVREMRHLSKLRHPCITTVMGAVIQRLEEPMLVMEYMEYGSLYDMLHNETFEIDGTFVLPILRDIAQGLRFLHAANPLVVHGDLKAQNILVDSKFRAKVTDFGLSQKKRIGATGTPLWMAPELLRGESACTTMSDVYSFGIILYEVYSRKDPYYQEDLRTVLQEVADPEINRRPKLPSACPEEVASMMADCVHADPLLRPTFELLDLRFKNFDIVNVEPGMVAMSKQRKRSIASINIVNSVFPPHIAQALQDGKKIEAETRELVTIFFCDIVGYTNFSSKVKARKVSDLLDRLYRQFDALAMKHDIFTVETVGDCYVAASNLIKEQPDGVKRIAEFSIDVCQVASTTLMDVDDPSLGYVNIRVGFHSGPVVANVVGRNPRYTLFGDTVNTSSRMESTSTSGRIQCSERSANLLRLQAPEIKVKSRGIIEIKGKGEMHTYWINEEEDKVEQS